MTRANAIFSRKKKRPPSHPYCGPRATIEDAAFGRAHPPTLTHSVDVRFLLRVYTVSVKLDNYSMIVSFADDATADLYQGRSTRRVRRFPQDILHRALVRLDVLNPAQNLMDLSSPPSSLEGLSGDWAEFHSMRVNKHFRFPSGKRKCL